MSIGKKPDETQSVIEELTRKVEHLQALAYCSILLSCVAIAASGAFFFNDRFQFWRANPIEVTIKKEGTAVGQTPQLPREQVRMPIDFSGDGAR